MKVLDVGSGARDVAEVLRAIARHVRPGGIIAFAEADFTTVLGYVQAVID